MQALLRRYAQFVVAHPWMVLLVSLLISAVMGVGATRLHVDTDPEKALPANNHYIALDRKIRKEFGGRNFVAIAVVPTSGTVWRTDVLQVVYQITVDLLNARGIIAQNVVSLSSPYVRIPKDRGGTLVIDYLMREVPADKDGVEALRKLYLSEPLVRGTVVSNDERAAMILADFYDDMTLGEIARIVDDVVARHRSSEIDIAMTGAPILAHTSDSILRRQFTFWPLGVLLIFIVLYFAFGQLQGVIIPSTTAILSTVWALGFMGFTGTTMNVWTATAPLMVVTVAAGHSAQMLKRYYEEFRRLGDRSAAIVESTSRIGVVMMAAGVTAGSGFAGLTLLGIPSLTQFGSTTACGILAAVILEMTFMVALRAVWPGGTGYEGPLSRGLGAVLRQLEAGVARRPIHTLLAFGAIALVALAGIPRLSSEIVARNYWAKDSNIGRDLKVFDEHFPSTTTFTVLLEGEQDSMRGPEAVRLMRGLTATMAQDPDVGRTSSVADSLERTYEVFSGEKANDHVFDDPALVGQLYLLAQSPALERYVERSYSRAVVTGLLNREESEPVRRLIGRLNDYLAKNPAPSIRVSIAGGMGPTLFALNEHTVEAKKLNIAMLLVVIFIVASFLLRTALGGAYVVAPLAMALIVNLGLFAWFRIAFDIVGATIAAIGIGVGADYAIYFLYRFREEFQETGDVPLALERTMQTSGRAVLFVALAISAGFTINIPSDFYQLRLLGSFVPTTMIVSCMTSLSLLPALVLVLRPHFIFGRK
jgi:uncharacterized protein